MAVDILGILGKIGSWAISHPGDIVGAVSTVANLVPSKKKQAEQLAMDEKLQQLGEAALELNQKIDTEITQVREEMDTLRSQVNDLTLALEAHRRSTKTALTIMGTALSAAIVVIAVLVILL